MLRYSVRGDGNGRVNPPGSLSRRRSAASFSGRNVIIKELRGTGNFCCEMCDQTMVEKPYSTSTRARVGATDASGYHVALCA